MATNHAPNRTPKQSSAVLAAASPASARTRTLFALGAIVLVVALLALVGCSSSSNKSGSASSQASAAASSASASAEAASSASAEASGPSASGENDKYAVSIDDAVVASDYNGDPALVVTFSWTNKSDDTTSFAVALHPKCFQNGVELETAIVLDGMDGDGYLADVRPGSGTTVQLAYSLKDQSPVEVEVGELISFDKTVLAARTFEIS